MDIDIIGRTTLKPLVYFYDDFFIFVFLNSYYCLVKLLRFITHLMMKIYGLRLLVAHQDQIIQ